MTRFIYYAASTLDGFIADKEDRIEWLLEFGMAEFQDQYDRFIEHIGAMVMGSKTYEFILGEGPDAWTYSVPAWVLTRRELPAVPGADIRFVQGPVEDVHAAALVAAAERDVWVVGGGDVAAQFARRGLLDDLQITVMPVVLGSGKPLLPVPGVTRPFTLVGSTPFPSGAVELKYRLTD